MSRPGFTQEQRVAITHRRGSLLVSAAAGAGKTTVLAERCAGLVCDAGDSEPCGVDELLVVTFTEAAAAHMRDRIGSALRARLASGPGQRRIEEQLALLPTASISTIHSFCLDLIRRWFSRAGVDPRAEVLSEEEAALLAHETLDAYFHELYAAPADDARARAFVSLVDDVFDGRDAALAGVVRRVHEFVRSLPNPQRWLAEAKGAAWSWTRERVAIVQAERLRTEITRQHAWVRAALAEWSNAQIDDSPHLRQIVAYRDALGAWAGALPAVSSTSCKAPADAAAVDALRTAIADFTMDARRGGRSRLDDADKERAEALFKRVRDRLLRGRLQADRAAFSIDEYTGGLARTAPHVEALLGLVEEFGRRYAAAKRDDHTLDFADLEQFALRLLADDADAKRPSAVARACHERYRYVLVDEFQDTSPVQEAILRLASRESAGRGDDGANLFAVGDVKQCIYAFRLAEPGLFVRRAERFRRGEGGALVHLRDNFRSRVHVLDAVNTVFAHCMTPAFAGVAYDDDARLRAGLAYPTDDSAAGFVGAKVEVHTLELPAPNRGGNADAESEAGEADDGAGNDEGGVREWHRVEREAYVIARRIRELMGVDAGGDEPHGDARRQHVYEPDADAPGGFRARPIRYRDIVILMRAARDKAHRVAQVLQAFDVPVHVELRAGYFETAEMRDMLALLNLLDNAKQDIPLAAVMRSPLAGAEPFSADDLAAIRIAAPHAAFHEAARQYATKGADDALRERLRAFFGRMERYRMAARRRALADVIAEILEDTGYLAYVGGLPHGRQRRAHLIGLHDRARQFGTFRRQGLRRFLRFIEELASRGEDLGIPSAASEADDVVRVMTVHQAKGLEFLVVFLADLGASFNLRDVREPVVAHRERYVAMKVVDADRAITYPSLAQQIVAEAGRRDSLAEELRILYVAMTRAKEHLVLVGSSHAPRLEAATAPRAADDAPIDALTLELATSPLEWVLQAAARTPGPFDVRSYGIDEIVAWPEPDTISPTRRAALDRYAALEPLPTDEPIAAGDAGVSAVRERLAFAYGPSPLTTMPARVAVTELKRTFDPFAEPDERQTTDTRAAPPAPPVRPRFAAAASRPAAHVAPAERGALTHRFLQQLDLHAATNVAAIRAQADAMAQAGRLSAGWETVLDVEAVAAFFATEIGGRLRAAADRVRREVTFVARIDPAELDATLRPIDARDMVLLRGMIDVLLPTPGGIELIDYKTDAVRPERVAERAETYRRQIGLYARAVEAIWRRPVTARWLVFLTPRQVVSL